MRKQKLRRLLFRDPSDASGIVAALFDQGEIGPDLFTAACNIGLEGIVSKRADRPYRAGRSKDWVKIKNQKHPAYRRVQDYFRRVRSASLQKPPKCELTARPG